LPDRLRTPELLPLGSRVRQRLMLDYAGRDELLASLDHLLQAAGTPLLMSTELQSTLADHAAGNYRVMMNMADELLAVAADRELPKLDESSTSRSSRTRPGPSRRRQEAMKTPSATELWAMPKLALVPALLAVIDGLLAFLHAQHGTLGDEWLPGDPRLSCTPVCSPTSSQLAQARAALQRYLRAVRRSIKAPLDQDPLPF
jgi:hypothetical protein